MTGAAVAAARKKAANALVSFILMVVFDLTLVVRNVRVESSWLRGESMFIRARLILPGTTMYKRLDPFGVTRRVPRRTHRGDISAGNDGCG